MRPAARTESLRPSPIRALGEGAPPGAISMGLGEPGWGFPAPARLALAEAHPTCAYGPNAGLPELRQAVADFFGEATSRVMLAAGSQGALFALFHAWLNTGDAVLVPDPGFLAYPALARMTGAEPVGYPLASDGSLDPQAFREALDHAPRARLAVINHPANPTGGGATSESLAAVASACAARDILLLSDEVYRELPLGPRPPSLRDVTDEGVVLGSVSKAWGAPGLRVGWALGEARWLEPARRIHAAMVTTPARPSQLAALALLRESQSVLAEARAQLRLRWETFAQAFASHFGAPPLPPVGGFYHWLPLPASALDDPWSFCLRLRDEGGVIVVPGSAFGARGAGHVRLSFGGDLVGISEGLRRLAPYWSSL